MEILALIGWIITYPFIRVLNLLKFNKSYNPRERHSDFPPMSERVFKILKDQVKSKTLIQKIKKTKENEKNRISNKR